MRSRLVLSGLGRCTLDTQVQKFADKGVRFLLKCRVCFLGTVCAALLLTAAVLVLAGRL